MLGVLMSCLSPWILCFFAQRGLLIADPPSLLFASSRKAEQGLVSPTRASLHPSPCLPPAWLLCLFMWLSKSEESLFSGSSLHSWPLRFKICHTVLASLHQAPSPFFLSSGMNFLIKRLQSRLMCNWSIMCGWILRNGCEESGLAGASK